MNLLVPLIEHLFNLICMIFMMRILLQLARADFNNPISQFIHKFTHPILNPMRSIVPDIGKFNTSCLAIIFAVIGSKFAVFYYAFNLPLESNQIYISVLLSYLKPMYIQLAGLFSIFLTLLTVLFIGLMVTSFIAGGQYNPATAFFHQVTRPLLQPLQKIIPPIGGSIDITPMILLLGLFYLQKLLVIKGVQFFI